MRSVFERRRSAGARRRRSVRRGQSAASRRCAATRRRPRAGGAPDRPRRRAAGGGAVRRRPGRAGRGRAAGRRPRRPALEARAQVERLLGRLEADPDGVARVAARQGPRLARALEEAGDHAGLARLWHRRVLLAGSGHRRARRRHAGAGRRPPRSGPATIAWSETRSAGRLGMIDGPTPVGEALVRCDESLERLHGDPWNVALVDHNVAGLRGMRGEFERAFALIDQANVVLAGSLSPLTPRSRTPRCWSRCWRAIPPGPSGTCAPAGGCSRPWGSGRCWRRPRRTLGWRRGPGLPPRGRSPGPACRQAHDPGRSLAAGPLAPDPGRGARGPRPHSRRRATADEAVALAAQTDYLNEHAGALEDLGHAHALAGHARDARRAREAALDLYRRKENTVTAVRLEGLVATRRTRASHPHRREQP